MNADLFGLYRRIEQIQTTSPPRLETATLNEYVQSWLKRRKDFLSLAQREGSPLYLFDPEALRFRARQFKQTFEQYLSLISCFYAMKSNSYPGISKLLHSEENFGLDVSSGRELEIALECGRGDIVFSGPGKTDEELDLAIKNKDRVTVLIDSFGELKRLQSQCAKHRAKVRAGVRITPPLGSWSKFGIPIERLREFWESSRDGRKVALQGIQFHTSWNLNPSAQLQTISALSQELASWPHALRDMVEFLDIGGGIWPPAGEWLQYASTPGGRIGALLGDDHCHPKEHFHNQALSLDEFARDLGEAVQREIFPDGRGRLCLEPGRWLSHESMHLLITVIDIKESGLAITDAGTNAIGWERFESDYAPVINLDRPGLEEHECMVVGSLCTPHDLWGYSFWGKELRPGDRLLVPDQGAYTYSLRQEFIKPLPKVVSLE